MGFARIEQKLDNRSVVESLPPMRRREDSSVALEERARVVGEVAKSKAKQIVDDPGASLTPEVVGELVQNQVKEALAEQREADRIRKLEVEAAEQAERRAREKTDEDIKAKERREFMRHVWSGIIVGLVLLVAGVIVAFAQGRMAGHDAGFAEGSRTSAPILLPASATAFVAVPSSPPAAPPPAPPPLPAAAGPHVK